ncbi:hypothetical protein BC830DRAFT_1098622 [Chytriomyces sp. MP71]|nr:hypothetical protein BC830DRAFT_1098622 [Chytriomyces sp. MP71]
MKEGDGAVERQRLTLSLANLPPKDAAKSDVVGGGSAAGVLNVLSLSDRSRLLSLVDEPTFEGPTALHSFIASLEGQVSVIKGDSLVLLDDSNSYWWLVRLIKTDEIGYVPAENIESPLERLARLNEKRNVILGCVGQNDGPLETDEVPAVGAASTSPCFPNSASVSDSSATHVRKVAFAPTLEIFEDFELDSDSDDDDQHLDSQNTADYAPSDHEDNHIADSLPASPTSSVPPSPTVAPHSLASSLEGGATIGASIDIFGNANTLLSNHSTFATSQPIVARKSSLTFFSKLRANTLTTKPIERPPISKPPIPNPRAPNRTRRDEYRINGNETSDVPHDYLLNSLDGAGGDAKPPINVLRVYAGNVDLQATFKTVALASETTTRDVLAAVLRRFKLAPPDAYYLSVLHMDSLERQLPDDARVQAVIEELQRRRLPGVSEKGGGGGGPRGNVRERVRADGTVVSRVRVNGDKIIKVILNRRFEERDQSPDGPVAGIVTTGRLLVRVFMETEGQSRHRTYKTLNVDSADTIEGVLDLAKRKFNFDLKEGAEYELCTLLQGTDIVLNSSQKVSSILLHGRNTFQETDLFLRMTRRRSMETFAVTPPRTPDRV